MGKTKERKKSNRKNQRRKQRKANTTTTTTTTTQKQKQNSSNFVSEAGIGCYIARRRSIDNNDNNKSRTDYSCDPDWMIEWEDINPKDFAICDCETIEVPDIALDPDEHTLSICNIDNYTKIAYVSVYDTTVVGGHGEKLIPGWTTTNNNNNNNNNNKNDNNNESTSCITFIVLCPPRVFAHLCYLINDNDGGNGANANDQDFISNIRIESDVSKWNEHPKPDDEHPFRIGFPLNCNNNNNNDDDDNSTITTSTSFLCTQGEGGELTHFFSGNLHAIDFRCPVGTELLAVADGIIIAAKDINTLTGIAVTNLFTWNSILLQISIEENYDNDGDGGDGDDDDDDDNKYDPNNIEGDDGPLFVEYVHISKSLVKAGDRVQRGQVIGYSGNVGFSPEPHLHFSAFRSDENEAPTVRVLFEQDNSTSSSSSSAGPDLVSIDNNEEYNNDSFLTFLPRAGEWYDSSGKVADT
jgi:murein DD-endopeptidase MepM/ murein hydrolase activator NlpD